MSSARLMGHIRQRPQPPAGLLALSKLIVCVIPIAQIAIGAMYMDSCPRQPYIPIYLVVVGSFGLLLNLLSCLPCAKQSEEDLPATLLNRICSTWNSLTSLFLFCWFIAGNVWIYSIYEPNYDPIAAELYCDKTLYLFAFWTTTLVYILLGLFMFAGCCMLICFCICGHPDADDNL